MLVPIPVGTPRPRPTVSDIVAAGQVLHDELERAIVRLRLLGVSWAGIGRSLGVSRQSAHARFRHLDDVGCVRVMATGSVADGTRRAVFWSTALGEELPDDGPVGLEHADAQLRALHAG